MPEQKHFEACDYATKLIDLLGTETNLREYSGYQGESLEELLTEVYDTAYQAFIRKPSNTKGARQI